MVCLLIQGGCGNQFFQYAYARSIAEKTGKDLYISWDKVENQKVLFRGGNNQLKWFHTKYRDLAELPIQKQRQVKRKIAYIEFIRLVIALVNRVKGYSPLDGRKYHQAIRLYEFFKKRGVIALNIGSSFEQLDIPNTDDIYILGYFESEKYFEIIKDDIKNELTVKEEYPLLNPCLMEVITSKQSVCISIKRRNLNNKRLMEAYNYEIDYFYRGLQYIQEKVGNVTVICFSDDIDWCKENFKWDGEIYYESGNDPIYEKVRLMSACKHFIIHNSTFSWWAQYLSTNKEKIVIAPRKWMDVDYPIDIYCDNWIYQDKSGEFFVDHV